MQYQTQTLPNGIRLIHKQTQSPIAHCGIIVNTGSRDEDENEHGMAHLTEHAIFKGTAKRKSFQIIGRVEDVGGEINAYTSKEETFIYSSFLNQYFNRTVELLSDIFFNSIFPDKEIQKEIDVIIDEINSYKDSPSELIYDEFEEMIFKNNSIGRQILGEPKKLKNFSKTEILNFIKKKYNTDEIVFCSNGNFPFTKVKKCFEKYFYDIPQNLRNFSRNSYGNYLPEKRIEIKDTYQTHNIIGTTAYSLKDKNRVALVLLNNIIGGQNMNSRLNVALREKTGYSYNVESNYLPYTDTGVFHVYFSCDELNLQKSNDLVLREFAKLKTKKLGIIQLAKAKRQLIGQIAISYESNVSLLLSMGKNFLHFNKVESLENIFKKIEAVSSELLIEISNEILDSQKLSFLCYK
ncbi:MAG: insulinase family protein [Bacteroidetes bacterium]|jgi:predicted Zn-dependent peptidase|nr:insulinase family protein [Bacteroidota bacterium]MBT6684870.1 insulinase family protein [Bacteroidota bacterium]MBT7142564.1 insulinase family protein [Bacteroidota bacterium]MBT7493261.1 insulinase family protein [Bacteroidota bacterium]